MADPFLLGSLALGGTLVNQGLNRSNMDYQAQVSKELMDYQWKNFNSPKAQVAAMTAAGLNPAAMFDGGKGSFAAPSVNMPTTSPVTFDPAGTLSSLSQYLLAKAQAKKAGAETKNLDIDAKSKQFEFELSKFFSAPEKIAAITLAWKNVMLKNDEHNINEWKQESEKALSQLKGIERDSAQKLLDNMDIQIEQENKQRSENIKLTQEKQKTEGTEQVANRAAAENYRSQADYNRESARLQRALADIEESGKSFKLESLLKHYRATGMLDNASYEKAYKLYKNLASINADNDKHSWNQAADDLFYYLGEKIHQISPIGSMLDIDYSKK